MTPATQRRRSFTRQFYKGNILFLLLSLFLILLQTGVNLLVSVILQMLLDTFLEPSDSGALFRLMPLCAVLVISVALIFRLDALSRPRFIATAMVQYKDYIFSRIFRKGLAAFSGEKTGFYTSALSNDANTIESDYLGGLFGLFSQCLCFVGALGLMLWYSPLLTAIAILLSLLPVAASLLAGNRVAQAEAQVSQENAVYMSALHDSLSGFSVVKTFRAEAAMCRLLSKQVGSVGLAKVLRQKTELTVECLGTVAGLIAQLGVFIAGAALSLGSAAISPGVLIAFVNLMNLVIAPIATIPQHLAKRKASIALIDKLAEALDENVRQEGTEEIAQLTRGIELKDLSFRYEEGSPALENIDFTFQTGKRYAIVGASGSGKSTLLNLLMAAHPQYSGSIRYDGTEVRDIRSESLYAVVSTVQQNVFVFNATIRDNITMFADFPEEAVERAIRLSGLSELIWRRGVDYLCGENGCNLSGGEKQRISIARSLLKQAQVLLVDEATAALDAQTAHQVLEAILDLPDLTPIVITHTLEASLLGRFDCILALKNGHLVESGTFGQLMEKKGYFYSLYTVSQS